jgi:hypothetical protein
MSENKRDVVYVISSDVEDLICCFEHEVQHGITFDNLSLYRIIGCVDISELDFADEITSLETEDISAIEEILRKNNIIFKDVKKVPTGLTYDCLSYCLLEDIDDDDILVVFYDCGVDLFTKQAFVNGMGVDILVDGTGQVYSYPLDEALIFEVEFMHKTGDGYLYKIVNSRPATKYVYLLLAGGDFKGTLLTQDEAKEILHAE